MDVVQMLVIAGAFIVAGIAKGAIGMGMPPIAIGLMSFAVPLESAIAIMVLPTMVTNIWQAIYGGGFQKLMRRFGTMAVTAMFGILAAGLLVSDLGSPSTKGWVSVVVGLLPPNPFAPLQPDLPRHAEIWTNPLIGLES